MNFLDLPCNVLWCIGIFPSSSSLRWAPWALYFYRAIIFSFLMIVIILMTIQLFVAPNLSFLARTIDIWTLFWAGVYKWFYMMMFSEEFAKLNMGLIRIQAQGVVTTGNTANQFTANYLKPIRPIAIWYLVSGMASAILILVNPLITFPKGDQSEFDYFNDSKSYPLSVFLPFTIKGYWMYYAFFASHCISLSLMALIHMGIDTFMFGAIYSIGGQIELLNSTISTIENSVAIDQSRIICKDQITYFTEKNQEICYSILRECSKHHILIRNYIKKISTNFSSLIIVDYLHGITSLTFAMFQLSNSGGISESMSVMLFIFISGSHQFLNNFFGEFIVQKQLSVGLAAYDVPWWRVNKKSRYVLALMIMRSNKPTWVTGFYMYKLCNNSFISFVKALYSYYMVLRRVNIEDKNA